MNVTKTFKQNDRVKLTQTYPGSGHTETFTGIVALVDTNSQPFIIWDDGMDHDWYTPHLNETLEAE